MPLLHLISSRPLSGKTTVAVALARGLAGAAPVRLVRTGAGSAAEEDAETFASYLFASSPGIPVREIDTAPTSPDETVLVESDAATTLLAEGAVLLVVRGAPTDADLALGRDAATRLVGSIATDVAPGAIEGVARTLTDAGLRPLAVIAEDRVLAAPSVAEIRATLDARVLYEAENDRDVVEDVLIGPVYADPAQPHFNRFASKAVLSAYTKTDLHLAAIETRAACLVITGGHDPSPYVIDRAQHGDTTVMLTTEPTPETLAALSDAWLTSRFRGDRKAEAAFAHMDGRVDFAALARRLEG
jgi:BioD-like phosphotransacetylase family protein